MDRLAPLFLALVVVLAGCGGVTGGDPTLGPEAATPNATETGGTGTATTGTPTAVQTANGTLTVHVINVGQASATLVVGPEGETMLVDTGDFTDDGEFVLDYLQAQGVERLDYLVTSHADADHIGGHAAVIDYYETEAGGVGAVYDPGVTASTRTYERYLDAVERHGVTLYETRAGDEIPMAGATVSVLGPPEERLAGGERNENSVVLRVVHGDTAVLLPGDAGREEEAYLVERYGDGLDSTVLLAGHHGSSTSSAAAFLDAVSPQAVVISSEYDSAYGHPHREVLDRLTERRIETLWTATHGDVVLTSNGSAVVVATERGAPTTADRLRDGSPVDPDADAAVERRFVVRPDGPVRPVAVPDGGSSTDGGDTDGDSGTEAQVELAGVVANPEGDDRERLTEETVTLRNAGDAPVDLSGWTLRDEAGHEYRFPDGTVLAPGTTVTVHTGSGTDTDSELYWDADGPVWNNDGDTVVLINADGDRVLTERYE
ncbi:lamin tail domain-containing protein [Halobium salinum]|uniref:Lamin tail domain-containing protein n=1 Tax=Halobium salinum TaxID=1364940 RepID=A0ABD5PDW6_9EURY|nr:lamin tail domain-containing protein [Halobium salinum]